MLFKRERRGHRHDDGGDQRDRRDVAVGEAVEPRQQNRRESRTLVSSPSRRSRSGWHGSGGAPTGGLGDRVPSGWAERPAPDQPTERERRATTGAVGFERFEGVRRTRRAEPARREPAFERRAGTTTDRIADGDAVRDRCSRRAGPVESAATSSASSDMVTLELDRTSVRPRSDGHRSATIRARGRAPARSCATGAGAGSVPPRRRRAVRWRRPRGQRPDRWVGEVGAPQGARGGTAHRHDRGGRRRHDLESNRSSRQAGATLGAAGLEHGPATAGAHAGAETVRLGTTTGVWLKGTLHGDLRIWGNTRRRPAWIDLMGASQTEG